MRPLIILACTLAMVASLSSGAAADVDEAHERLDHTLTALIEAEVSAVISRSIERRVDLLSLGRESSSHPASPAAYPADIADRSTRRSGALRPSRVPTSTRMRCARSTRDSLECLVVPLRSRGPAGQAAPR